MKTQTSNFLGSVAILATLTIFSNPSVANSLTLKYDSPIGQIIETQGIIDVDPLYSQIGNNTGTYKSFHATKDGFLEIWTTKGGERSSTTPLIRQSVKESFTYRWPEFGEQDREIRFAPTVGKKTVQREAFFVSGVMQDWDNFWNTQPSNFSSVWPFIIDAGGGKDLFVGVDLTAWHNNPIAFNFGGTYQITNGQSSLLPGFTIGETDISYVIGQGWINTQPFTGSVQLGASDGEKTPEPTSTLGLLALGTLGAASTLKRKLKPSKLTEKETTKVS